MNAGSRLLLLAGLLSALGRGASATIISLVDIDSGLTSPTGNYRWLDVADQTYNATYRSTYNYTQATVQVEYEESATTLRGTLTATNLKPNFAYQLKLAGMPGTDSNERIGFAGRWWEQSWTGSDWSNGANLNNKGDGSSPNPNDLTYLSRRDVPNPTSPTGLQYKYSGYLVMDYFITDGDGNAALAFEADSSYHVLWKTSQRAAGADDGPVKIATFDAVPSHPAYDGMPYSAGSVGVFGEWERLPVGGVFLDPGYYSCSLILTEESFHGSGGTYAGGWAAAMGGDIEFTIVPEPSTLILLAAAGSALLLRKRT